MADIDKKVKAAADTLGLDKYLDRKPKALSGGQRQRVALGRAIVREPKVFLMDEPLSNLDAKLRVQTRAEILRLHRRLGATMIYVTHDQVEAMTMGDRIAVMRDGLLQQAGTPQDLYSSPANLFVAGFIGSPAMNLAAAKTSDAGVIFGDVRVALSGSRAEAAAKRPVGTEVTLGFRPEHLELAAAGSDGDSLAHIPASIDVVEFLGNDELIHAQAEGLEILALVSSSRKAQVGDKVDFTIPMDKLYLFDTASGESLVN